MRTRDDIRLPEEDVWGADHLDWEDEEEEEDANAPVEEPKVVLDDPRY